MASGLVEEGESVSVYEEEVLLEDDEDSFGTEVARVAANDSDTGANSKITFRLLTGNAMFKINAISGAISLKQSRPQHGRCGF